MLRQSNRLKVCSLQTVKALAKGGIMKYLNNIIKFSKAGDFDKWEQDCQPIGNAYMGASFFGGISREKIVLNEKTLWTGGPAAFDSDYYGGNQKNRYPYVKQVQQLLSKGRYDDAKELLPMLTGLDHGSGAYQLLCNLYLEQFFCGEEIDEKLVCDYSRCLDMDRAVFTTDFTYENVHFRRTAFANYPSNVICIKLEANKDSQINAKAYLGELQECGQVKTENRFLIYFGAVKENRLRYCMELRIEVNGGTVTAEADRLTVKNADSAVLYITASTDYSPYFKDKYRNGTDPLIPVSKRLDEALKKGFDKLYDEHEKDYGELFNRCGISLNGIYGEPLDADKLVEGYKEGDLGLKSMLEELYFQFGRYMLISSSRSGSLPANLQGVWNETNCPPWNCDYHTNVNLQMNYWGAYNTNLAETAYPLVDFMENLRPAGRITAKEYYGIESTEDNPENGWAIHTAVNPFGWTAPGWDFYWGWCTAAAAWLMQNIWEYYEFTEDKKYLENRIYPIMAESVRFYGQWLIFDDKQQRLVSSPTYSPEHGPVTVGNTYEQSLIEQLYRDFIRASEILGKDGQLREKIKRDVEMLKPYYISNNGLIKEWFEEDEKDFDRSQIQQNHRHISHLMGLYPGKAITCSTPDLMKAAINTLNDRGDQSTGWARAYKLNLWARTGDGNRAYSIFSGLLSDCTFNNLFDFHPPFQLDGNFGGSAGIAEMLLQSHEGYINPLAALPDCWSRGEFRGLCARGGFVVSAEWKDKKLISLKVLSKAGKKLIIKCDPLWISCDGNTVDYAKDKDLVVLETDNDKEYVFGF